MTIRALIRMKTILGALDALVNSNLKNKQLNTKSAAESSGDRQGKGCIKNVRWRNLKAKILLNRRLPLVLSAKWQVMNFNNYIKMALDTSRV
jgi:hypothetical protein